MKIGFVAGSRFGLPSLHMLLQNRIPVSIVVPEREGGETEDLVQLAGMFSQPVHRITRSGAKEQITLWFENERPEVVIVLTYPYKIPEELLLSGTPWYNFHFAPLPAYRGAQPLFWLIRNREPHGAVSVHYMTETLDAGPLVLQEEVPLNEDDTYGMHSTRLSQHGATVVATLWQRWLAEGTRLPSIPQDESRAKTYARPGAQDLIIDWQRMSAEEIRALCQAANPWNKGAISFLDGQPCRLTSVSLIQKPVSWSAGSLHTRANGHLGVGTQNGVGLSLDIISTEEGIYTGAHFARYYPVEGKRFTSTYT